MKKNNKLIIVNVFLFFLVSFSTSLFAQKSTALSVVQTEDGKTRTLPVSVNNSAPISVKRATNDEELKKDSIIYLNKQEKNEESIIPPTELNTEPEK